MGHKRKKFSERVAERNVKGYDESPFKKTASDTPKGFARIMFKKESIEKKLKESKQAGASGGAKGIPKTSKTNNGETKNGKKSAADDLKIMPGEKMRDFSRRVDDYMRDNLIRTTKDGSSTGSKKKKYFEKQKEKEKAKKLKSQEERAYEEFETIRDNVRLNDVAQAPPTLTAVPKKRKNDEFMVDKKWKNIPGEEDYDDVLAQVDAKEKKRKLGNSDETSTGAKRSRLKNLTPAGRRIIEEERKQAIENYRLMKARKAMDKTPRNDGDDEDE